MRAMQSRTALVEELDSIEIRGKGPSSSFAALQFAHRRRDQGVIDDVVEEIRGSDGEMLGTTDLMVVSRGGRSGPVQEEARSKEAIADGAGMAHDAGNLLGALSLFAELLAVPGVLNEPYREYADDLRLLSERSVAMVRRLLESAHPRACSTDDGELTRVGNVVEQAETAGRAVALRLVRAEAGWIAC